MQVYCKDCDKILLLIEIDFNEYLTNAIKNQVVNEINVNHRGHLLILDLTNDELLITEKLKKLKTIINNSKAIERLRVKK